MENASKALIMAAGVLIGILILSLAVFLFADFGATSKGIYSQMEESQLTQYNSQYTIYSGRDDITIYEIISLANLAKENNEYYKGYSDYENSYKVMVVLNGTRLETLSDSQNLDKMKDYSTVNVEGDLEFKFECHKTTYHENGRINSIEFRENN